VFVVLGGEGFHSAVDVLTQSAGNVMRWIEGCFRREYSFEQSRNELRKLKSVVGFDPKTVKTIEK
jgi:hypothetical protein